MWVAKVKVKHDCIIGNRCEKFKVTTTGMPFNVYMDKGITYSPQIQTLHGDEENIKGFIEDLKKDKRVTNLETEGNVIFLIEKRKEKIPATFYCPQLIYAKPNLVDKEGYERWEVASWKRSIITDFVANLQKEIKDVEVLKIKQTKLTDVYFSHLAPKLTPQQKKAFELAFEKGYYSWPKKTGLGKLAMHIGISVPTFREHLKKAEEKLMPDLVRQIE